MNRKILSAFLCSVILAGTACGCNNQMESNNQVSPDETNLSSSVDAGTLDSLNHMTLCGKRFSFPCLYGDFDDAFTLGNGYYFDDVGYTYYEMFQGEKIVASIGIEGEQSENNNDKKIVMMIVEREQLADLTIGDITGDSEQADWIQMFGEPDNKSDDEKNGLIEYLTESIDVTIIFKNGKANELTLVVKGE